MELVIKGRVVTLTVEGYRPGRSIGRKTARPDLDRNSDDWAEYLRETYRQYVTPTGPDKHWKGPCKADAPNEMVDDVREAMNFMGSIVDDEDERESVTVLRSKGYWAHGF